MERKILLAVILLLAVSTAAAFPAELEVVDRTATSSDPAVFNLTVENDYSETDTFRISSILSPPVTSRWFNYDYSRSIASGETGFFEIEIYPDENAIQQNYAFEVNVRSHDGGELVEIEDYFYVTNRYDLSVTSFSLSDRQLRPGDRVNISATVKNTASRTMDDFRVDVSGFDQNQTETGTVLGSSDSIRYNFQLKVPGGEMPDNETIRFGVYSGDERQQFIQQEVKVAEIKEVRRSAEIDDRVLTTTRKVRLENMGNVPSTSKVNHSIPVYLDPLVTFNREPDVIQGEGAERQYVWNVDLEPGESEYVEYTVNYVPALGFLAMLFIGILGMKKLQTDINFSKESKLQDGQVKITIEIKNNSGTPQRNLEVKAFVPDIAEVSKEFDFARPVKTKTSSGTRLRWDIERLEPGEQRVFEYRIKPLVEVEGGVVLPSAEISKDGTKLKESSEIEAEFNPE